MDFIVLVARYFISLFCVMWTQPEFGTRSQSILETSEVNVSTIQGKDAILPCMTFTSDTAVMSKYKVTWTNPNKAIISINQQMIFYNNRFSIVKPYTTDWNLRIARVQRSDSGKYTCSINTLLAETKAVFLLVQVPPRISSDKKVEVIEGESLDVHCNVTGDPPPTVSWYKEGAALPKFTGNVLQIVTAKRTESGNYTCEATNGVEPNAQADIYIDVLYPPVVELIHKNIGQFQSENVILNCTISGNPIGVEKWFRDGNEIKTNWKYMVENHTKDNGQRTISLLIRYLDKKDFGEYIFKASNTLGSISASVHLYELTSVVSSTIDVTAINFVPDGTATKTISTKNNPLSTDLSNHHTTDGTKTPDIDSNSQDKANLFERSGSNGDNGNYSSALIFQLGLVYFLYIHINTYLIF